MADVQSSGIYEIIFRDAQGVQWCATLAIRYACMTVRPPIAKQKKYPHQTLQIVHAEEIDPPEGRDPVGWKLITNLAVESHEDAGHKLQWYARRRKIETFFKTLKTGCKIENMRLTTADRLANCIALCCVVAWRISWLAVLQRQSPTASSAVVFTDTELRLLEQTMPSSRKSAPRDLKFFVTAVARLGGYLDRSQDAPPGTTVIWRGFERLKALTEGFEMASTSEKTKLVGN